MLHSPNLVTYLYRLPDGRTRSFDLRFDPTTYQLQQEPIEQPPSWTALSHCQCSHCPLKVETTPHCPLALSTAPLVEFAKDMASYSEMKVEVITKERTYQLDTTAQRAMSSMLGLIIPTSGCPLTECLRPLARYHVPDASPEETLARVMSFYLLSLHVADRRSAEHKPVAFDKLKRIYDDLHTINRHMAERLKTVCEKDSTLNAIVILDTFTMFLPMEIDDSLRQIKTLVEPMVMKLDELPE